QHAQGRIELVDVADRRDPRGILGHTRPIAEAGGPGVTGAGHDSRQPMSHGRSILAAGAGSARTGGGRCPSMMKCRRTARPSSCPTPMPRPSTYDRDLDRTPANFAPLTPLSLIARTAYTYPERTSVVHGDRRYTWAETYARARRLASALVRAGIGKGDTVA